jgi:uncharacterized protein (DUF697 family)
VSRWSNLGTILSTLRELDVNAIREESEQDIVMTCFGSATLFDTVAALLSRDTYQEPDWPGGARYGPVGSLPLFSQQSGAGMQRIDMLLLLVDARRPLPRAAHTALDEFRRTSLPFLIVVLHGDTMPGGSTNDAQPLFDSYTVTLPDPAAPEAASTLAEALLARLPAELHLAAARRLPALRPSVARSLIESVSFSNGTYALVSGVGEQFPVLNLTVAAADMLLLTKNQALMTYKLALAHGAPPDLTACLRELVSVVGMGYIWRQAARTLVGLLPLVGIPAKVGVAYAGTYTVGTAAWRWFARGELVSRERIEHMVQEGQQQARHMLAEMQAATRREQVGTRKRVLWPRRRSPGTPLADDESDEGTE